MYELTYRREDGVAIQLDLTHNIIVSTIGDLTGHAVSLSTSQGFGQIGTTVTDMSIGAKTLTVNGKILDGDTLAKKALISTFTPGTRGKLYWYDGRWMDVVVAKSPSISQERHSVFMMQLYAPFPFWRDAVASNPSSGKTTPMFSFPVNYATAHKFGVTAPSGYVECPNRGDVAVDFSLKLSGTANIVNPVISNHVTGKALSFTGTIPVGTTLNVYRKNGELRVTTTANGVETLAFDLLDDDSTLYELVVGENTLYLTADSGASTASLEIIYYNAYSGVLARGV